MPMYEIPITALLQMQAVDMEEFLSCVRIYTDQDDYKAALRPKKAVLLQDQIENEEGLPERHKRP